MRRVILAVNRQIRNSSLQLLQWHRNLASRCLDNLLGGGMEARLTHDSRFGLGCSLRFLPYGMRAVNARNKYDYVIFLQIVYN